MRVVFNPSSSLLDGGVCPSPLGVRATPEPPLSHPRSPGRCSGLVAALGRVHGCPTLSLSPLPPPRPVPGVPVQCPLPSAPGGGQGTKGTLWGGSGRVGQGHKPRFSRGRRGEIQRFVPVPAGRWGRRDLQGTFGAVWDTKIIKKTPTPNQPHLFFTNNLLLNYLIYIYMYLCQNKNGTWSANSLVCAGFVSRSFQELSSLNFGISSLLWVFFSSVKS